MADDEEEERIEVPQILAEAGLTFSDFAAFAGAAVRFYGSALRRALLLEDLIRVEEPIVHPDLHYAMWAMLGPALNGLVFFENRQQWERLGGLKDAGEDLEDLEAEEEGEWEWEEELEDLESLWKTRTALWEIVFEQRTTFDPETRELWERYGAPSTPEGLCPFPVRPISEGDDLPNGKLLAYLEGLLEALATTTEEELDRGRWEKTVATSRGETRYVLSLPNLLEPREEPGLSLALDPRTLERRLYDLQRLIEGETFDSVEAVKAYLSRFQSLNDIPRAEPVTPEDQANELIDAALEARGRRRLQLARRALEVWPDCVEAYVLQAELCQEAEDALVLYEHGVGVGRRALGPLLEEPLEGDGWSQLRLRPYLRALKGVTEASLELGYKEEAIDAMLEMLRVEPDDSMEMRDLLVTVLLDLGRDEEVREMLKAHTSEDTEDNTWQTYTWALLSYRQGGNSPEARRRLKKAVRANPFVPLYLTEIVLLPLEGPAPQLPDAVGEAATYSSFNLALWKGTPGAVEWLEAQTSAPGPRRPRAAKKPRKPKKKNNKKKGKTPKRRR